MKFIEDTNDTLFSSWNLRSVVIVLFFTILLCIPAFINGYPIVYYDTGTYLEQAIKLSGELDRPPYYSMFLFPLHFKTTLWGIVFAQGLIGALTITLFCKVFLPTVKGIVFIPFIALLALSTSLSWQVSQILPDFFTGIMVIALLTLFFNEKSIAARRTADFLFPIQKDRRIDNAYTISVDSSGSINSHALSQKNKTENDVEVIQKNQVPQYVHTVQLSVWSKLFLWGVVFISLLFHLTHIPILFGISCILFFIQCVLDKHNRVTKAYLKFYGVTLCLIGFAFLGQVAYTYALVRKIAPSPLSSVFLLARSLERGPAKQVLKEDCPLTKTEHVSYELCKYLDRIPSRSDDFLWSPSSPIQTLYSDFGVKNTIAEAGLILRQVIKKHPFYQFYYMGEDIFFQLIRFQNNDILIKFNETLRIVRVIKQYFQGEYESFTKSKQYTATLPLSFFKKVENLFLVLALCSLFYLLLFKREVFSTEACILLFVITGAYIFNAVITGGFSEPIHRYGYRVIWLFPFALSCLLISCNEYSKKQKICS
jgi:hypothetical protein